MERWKIARCENGRADFYLKNRTKTLIKVSSRAHVDLERMTRELTEIGFPLKFTEGIRVIKFQNMRYVYGDYYRGEIRINIRKTQRMNKLLETFVHEVAHHIDGDDEDFSSLLTKERERLGRLIHKNAEKEDAEYWARGFERFYSKDVRDKKRLRQCHKLYRMILKLHKEFSRVPRKKRH